MPARLALPCLLALCAACNMPKHSVDKAAKFSDDTDHAIEAFWDLETAVEAMPSVIVQYEGMLALSPDNERVQLGLSRALMAYAAAYLEQELTRAVDANDPGEADYYRHRAARMYVRARDLGMRAMEQRHAGLEAAVAGGADALGRHVREGYDGSEERDVRPLAITGLAWGAAIALGGLPKEEAGLARTLVEHAVALIPGYDQCAGLAFLGASHAEADGAKAKQYFERGLSLCKRRNHHVQVGYAEYYAARAGDRELYDALLEEVVSAGDQGDEVRLRNKLARRRAQRLITRADRLFAPAAP